MGSKQLLAISILRLDVDTLQSNIALPVFDPVFTLVFYNKMLTALTHRQSALGLGLSDSR